MKVINFLKCRSCSMRWTFCDKCYDHSMVLSLMTLQAFMSTAITNEKIYNCYKRWRKCNNMYQFLSTHGLQCKLYLMEFASKVVLLQKYSLMSFLTKIHFSCDITSYYKYGMEGVKHHNESIPDCHIIYYEPSCFVYIFMLWCSFHTLVHTAYGQCNLWNLRWKINKEPCRNEWMRWHQLRIFS